MASREKSDASSSSSSGGDTEARAQEIMDKLEETDFEKNLDIFKIVYILFASEVACRLDLYKEAEKLMLQSLEDLNDVGTTQGGVLSTFVASWLFGKRCTFSFLTDTSTLNLAQRLLLDDTRKGRRALIFIYYNCVIAYLVLNSSRLFNGMGGPFTPSSYPGEKNRLPLQSQSSQKKYTALEGHASKNISLTPPPSLLQAARLTLLQCDPAEHPTYNVAVPQFLRLLNDPLYLSRVAEILQEAEGKSRSYEMSLLHISDQTQKRVRQLRQFGAGRKAKLPLPEFLTYVILRFMSIKYPSLKDWESDEIGQGAVKGCMYMTGYPEERILKDSKTPANIREAKETLRKIKRELQHLFSPEEKELLRALHKGGLAPMALVNIEHMVCEYRKIMLARTAERKIPSRTNFRDYVLKIWSGREGRTPDTDLRKMYRSLRPLYVARQKFINDNKIEDRHVGALKRALGGHSRWDFEDKARDARIRASLLKHFPIGTPPIPKNIQRPFTFEKETKFRSRR